MKERKKGEQVGSAVTPINGVHELNDDALESAAGGTDGIWIGPGLRPKSLHYCPHCGACFWSAMKVVRRCTVCHCRIRTKA